MLPAATGSQKKRRSTRHITLRQANNLVAACAFAKAIGCRLNVSIDVFWLMFSGWEGDAIRLAKAQQRLSKWFVRRGFRLTMIWVREVGANGGLHTHILLHVPPWLMESGEFENAFERSFEPEGGAPTRKPSSSSPLTPQKGSSVTCSKASAGATRRDSGFARLLRARSKVSALAALKTSGLGLEHGVTQRSQNLDAT